MSADTNPDALAALRERVLGVVRSHVLPIGDNVDYSRGWEAARYSIEQEIAALAAAVTAPTPDAFAALREAGKRVVEAWDARHIRVVGLPGIDPMDALRAAIEAPPDTAPAPLDVERLARTPVFRRIVDDTGTLESYEEVAALILAEYVRLAEPR